MNFDHNRNSCEQPNETKISDAEGTAQDLLAESEWKRSNFMGSMNTKLAGLVTSPERSLHRLVRRVGESVEKLRKRTEKSSLV